MNDEAFEIWWDTEGRNKCDCAFGGSVSRSDLKKLARIGWDGNQARWVKHFKYLGEEEAK